MIKFLGLIVGSFTALAIALATIHFWGLGQAFLPFENKFYEPSKPWLIVPWEQNFFLEKKKDLVLWANVYQAREGDTLLVAPSSEKVDHTRIPESQASPARPALADLIHQFPGVRFILNIQDNHENIHQRVENVLQSEAKQERFLIQSPYNVVLASIKELMPRLVYGSTPSDLMRLKSFQSMFILTASPFKGDALVTDLNLRGRNAIDKDISAELKRRYKMIIFGPLQNKDEAEQALGLGADGLYVEKPEWALQWLSERLSQNH